MWVSWRWVNGGKASVIPAFEWAKWGICTDWTYTTQRIDNVDLFIRNHDLGFHCLCPVFVLG
jgi:hypothetical protein